ncbi:2Fe-2S iron-sulfur cluster-binding protein [Limnohabitans sp.]|jgi:vanillate O-demethylase ferredoxin subunit|uniref:2Fe-2S iron-sulfur cluster-binding protein n=1 Tax=Limnohabitans sp. TaxID=1907725 RepID=UPI0037BED4B4
MSTADLSQTPIAADGTFEVQLQKSGQTLPVGKDQSILKVLQDAGHDAPFSCSEGICGTCLTQVLAGTPDHWDSYLTPAEQAKGDVIMVCCSRSQTARLVLDL